MKKESIFIYDPETNKLIQVCDVRDLTSDQFEKFSKEAKANITKLLKEKEREKKCLEATIEKHYDEHQTQLNNVRSLIKHILGIEELTEEEIKEMLYIVEEETHEEQ